MHPAETYLSHLAQVHSTGEGVPKASHEVAQLPREAAPRPWTKLDSIPEYEDIIRRARAVANGKPLAAWELQIYDQNSLARKPGSANLPI